MKSIASLADYTFCQTLKVGESINVTRTRIVGLVLRRTTTIRFAHFIVL